MKLTMASEYLSGLVPLNKRPRFSHLRAAPDEHCNGRRFLHIEENPWADRYVIEHVPALKSGNCNKENVAGVGASVFWLGAVLIVIASVEHFLYVWIGYEVAGARGPCVRAVTC